MKKIIKRVLLTIMILVSMTTIINVQAATTAPSTITMGTGEQLPGYIGGTYFSTKVTNDGKYAYCLDINKKVPHTIKMNLVEAKDAGVAYIIKNGYPNKSITGNDKYDYYITQTALWWYLDETAGTNNLSNNFKETGSDEYGLRKYVRDLKNKAKSAKTAGYTEPSVSILAGNTNLTLSSDNKYYYSSEITITSKSTGNITLTLTDAPKGTKIVDTKGNEKTSVTSGTKVKIKVPANEISNLKNTFSLTAKATGKIDKAYMYQSSNSKYQPVVISVLYSETKEVKATKNFSLASPQVEITKIDSETGKALAGAKLQLKDKNGNIIDTWTSTTSGHVIKNIPEGTYTIEELEAPNGYKLNDTKQEVVIKAGVLTKVSFYNSKKEPTKVVIIKRDSKTNETLEGAIFVLRDSEGKEITRWTSTKNGHYVSGLPEGEYTIEEIEAPAGYVKSDEIKTVKLESGKKVTVTFYNTPEYDSALRIVKVDGETGENLSGATMQLKNENGEVVYTWTTTEEAYVIEDIAPGKYYLSETNAPEGYVLSTEVVEIIINENGGTQTITFYNTPEVEVPNTATSISKSAIIVGAIIVAIGGSIIYFNLRKEEN